jgi:hypothetical protein
METVLSAVSNTFLTISVRKDICELSADDAVNEDIVNESTISCKSLFRELCQMMELQPAIREYRLAQKRSEKNLRGHKTPRHESALVLLSESALLAIIAEYDFTSASQSAVEISLPGKSYGDLQGSSSASSAPRNISGVSTLDANVNSTGGDTILFSKEVTTQAFCGVLFAHLCGEVWPKGILLTWVEGRDARLNWSKSYVATPWLSINCQVNQPLEDGERACGSSDRRRPLHQGF